MSVERAEIVAAARALVGTPWRHMGRGPGGLDCVGVVIAVARAVGIVAPDFDLPPYPAQPDGSMARALARHLVRRKRGEIAPGAVLVFGWRLTPWHVGIATDPAARRLVHGVASRGRVEEAGFDPAPSAAAPLLLVYDFPGVSGV